VVPTKVLCAAFVADVRAELERFLEEGRHHGVIHDDQAIFVRLVCHCRNRLDIAHLE
jgi:hypothetical protein